MKPQSDELVKQEECRKLIPHLNQGYKDKSTVKSDAYVCKFVLKND